MTLKIVNEAKFVHGEEEVIVRMFENGEVEVERIGFPYFRPSSSYKEVVAKYKQNGWAEDKAQTGVTAESQGIPLNVQQELDEFLEIHEQLSELKRKAEGLKKNIRSYMEKNDHTSLKGSNGKRVVLQDAFDTNATSRYTDYRLEDVVMVLKGKLLPEVTEIRVNADKVDALIKQGKLPKGKVEELQALKIKNPGNPRFVVKK